MHIDLTPDQEAVIRRGIEVGRLASAEAAVGEAMSLWVERERKRAELLMMLDESEASLACGEGTEITVESMKQLAADVNRRGRDRLERVRKSST